MSSSAEHNTNILRNTPGLTSLFRSNVRRSRSLASLQREANADSMMRSRTPQAGFYATSSMDQTPPRPQLQSVKTMNSPEGLRPMGPQRPWFANQSVVQQQNTRTPSPPSRPKPAPRLWTEDDDEPDIKPSFLAMQSGPGRIPPPQMRQPPMSSNGPTNYQRDPRSQSPLGQSIQASRERSLSRRRKPSVAELSLDPLTTVTEWSQESPVVQRRTTRNLSDPSPRHPDTHSAAAAAQRTPRAGSQDDSARTPQPGDNQFLTPSGSSSSTLTPMAAKRASSMLLPFALAPLITSSPPQVTSYNPMSPEGDKPPVPPKEPGYKATPQKSTTPRPPPPAPSASASTVSSVNHSAKSSVSDADWSVSSSVTTLSPIEMPNTWPVELPNREDAISPTSIHPEEEKGLPWVMKEYKAVPARKPIASPPKAEEPESKVPSLSPPTNHHQRNVSDSVLNRGRPTKRGNQHRPQRTISRDLRLANIAGTINDLPEGYDKVQALSTFSQKELCNMRRDADCEASGFVAMETKDVEELRKESELLEKHCDELRRRCLSLRESRTQLHERMLGYLKAPGNQLVSREYMLKQQGELSELDAKIDDTTTKLEAAQDRGMKVQRKLLEHVAAVLALKFTALGSAADEQTPPRSPEDSTTSPAAEQPSDIIISIDANFVSPTASPAVLEAAEAKKLEAEERAYIERIQLEREVEERREVEQHAEAEKQSQELERELRRQQEERDSPKSKKSSPAKSPQNENQSNLTPRSNHGYSHSVASPQNLTPTPKPNPGHGYSQSIASPQSPQMLLSQERYHPPARSTSLNHLTDAIEPAPAKQPSPREEVTQSIQIYAGEDIYQQHEEGIDSLLSSIEQEIDAIDRSRATAVY